MLSTTTYPFSEALNSFCDVLQKRCFLMTTKKCLEAKSSVGPTLFKLKSKPILTSLPKDRGSLVNFKRTFNTTPPPSKLENLPEFHSGTRNGALFVGEGFYPLFSLGLLTICAWIPMRYWLLMSGGQMYPNC